jgi:hypothetical protein
MFVGYSLDHTADGYEMWNPATLRVYQTRDVIWLNWMYYNRKELAVNIVIEPEMEPIIVYHTYNPVIAGSGEGNDNDDDNQPTVDENNNIDDDEGNGIQHFYCDNQGLITRLNHAAGPLKPFPRHFLRSDIDLELQILDTIRLLAIHLSYHHVKGHQDDAEPTDVPLTREAQLNVECDVLATAALVLLPSLLFKLLSSRPAKSMC